MKKISEIVELKPKAFLIRIPVPCYRRAHGRPKSPKSPMRVYIRDQLAEGEVLNFDAIHNECVEQSKPACCCCWLFGQKTTTIVTEEQYLRCTDLDGREVLLDLNLEGLFSPLGDLGSSSQDCVYQLGDVVRNSDLPTHMKLCWGQPPSSPCSFTGLLRLEDVYFEETVIACTLGSQRHFMVEFPTDSEIKFIIASDAYRFFDHPVIQKAMDQCDEQIESYVNSIKVVQSFYPEHIKLKTRKGEENKTERSLPPLPLQHDGLHNESMDTTGDDFTDDSEFSDYTSEDGEDHGGRHQEVTITTTLEPHHKPAKKVNHVKISDEAPVIIYDDSYEEIPGLRPQKDSPPPAVTTITMPPPPPGFTGSDETVDKFQALPLQSSYSRTKLERTTSHPETVPVNDHDIIAPPNRWSDMNPDHRQIGITASDSALTAQPDSHLSNGMNNGHQAGVNGGSTLGHQLRERLDAFLADSLQELHRLQGAGDPPNGSLTPMSTASADGHLSARGPRVPPKPARQLSAPSPQALQSHEDINAFLETIFDPDSMTDDVSQMKNRSGTLPHPRARPVTVSDDSVLNKPQYRVTMSQPDATLRRHNVKSLSVVQPPPVQRPNHLPVQPHTNGTQVTVQPRASNNPIPVQPRSNSMQFPAKPQANIGHQPAHTQLNLPRQATQPQSNAPQRLVQSNISHRQAQLQSNTLPHPVKPRPANTQQPQQVQFNTLKHPRHPPQPVPPRRTVAPPQTSTVQHHVQSQPNITHNPVQSQPTTIHNHVHSHPNIAQLQSHPNIAHHPVQSHPNITHHPVQSHPNIAHHSVQSHPNIAHTTVQSQSSTVRYPVQSRYPPLTVHPQPTQPQPAQPQSNVASIAAQLQRNVFNPPVQPNPNTTRFPVKPQPTNPNLPVQPQSNTTRFPVRPQPNPPPLPTQPHPGAASRIVQTQSNTTNYAAQPHANNHVTFTAPAATTIHTTVHTQPTSITTAGHSENIFIPIRRPDSASPPQDSGGSSGDFPREMSLPSPERDFPHRADSGVFVSPGLSDSHADLDSPYQAPSEDPTWSPPDDLAPLSVTDIAHCLRYIGMKDKVVFRFVEEQIDGQLLLELDADLLKEGFPELNALERKKVLDLVRGWRPKKL